jgi:hypothetical protein
MNNRDRRASSISQLSRLRQGQIYDREGVWPPPQRRSVPDDDDGDDDYTHRHRERWHRAQSSFTFDPFFSQFGSSRSPFGFTDPFELFERVFQDAFDQPRGGWANFDRSRDRRNQATFSHSPFSPVSRSPWTPFQEVFSSRHMSTNPFQGSPMFQSSEIITQTVNGVTTTVKRRIDAEVRLSYNFQSKISKALSGQRIPQLHASRWSQDTLCQWC